MWTFVLQCGPNADHFEQKGPHVDLCRKMWTYLATVVKDLAQSELPWWIYGQKTVVFITF